MQERSQVRNPRWISKISRRALADPGADRDQERLRAESVWKLGKFAGLLVWTWRKYKEIWSFTLRLPTFELWSCFIDHFTHIKDKILPVNIHGPIFNRKHLSNALLGSGDTEMNRRPAVHSRYFSSTEEAAHHWTMTVRCDKFHGQVTHRGLVGQQQQQTSSLVWGTIGRWGGVCAKDMGSDNTWFIPGMGTSSTGRGGCLVSVLAWVCRLWCSRP